jgi:two-component system OmpR family response regulator
VAILPENHTMTKASVLSFEGWRLDLAMRQLHAPDGTRVVLTSGEFDLLVALCQHPHRVLTRDQLLDLIHGRAAKIFDRSIDIRISRLRRKIEVDPKLPKIIATVRSGGYFFAAQVTVA